MLKGFFILETDNVAGFIASISKRILDIRKIFIKFLKRFTDLSNKEIANLFEIGSSTVTNVLSERYSNIQGTHVPILLTITNVLTGRHRENDFIIKSSTEIEKNG